MAEVCQYCNQAGHKTKECPKIMGTQIKCPYCEHEGRDVKNCPQIKENISNKESQIQERANTAMELRENQKETDKHSSIFNDEIMESKDYEIYKLKKIVGKYRGKEMKMIKKRS